MKLVIAEKPSVARSINEEEYRFLYMGKNDELNQSIQLSENNNGFILGNTVHSQTVKKI